MDISKTTNKKGRPAAEGKAHKYVVPDDVHDWIKSTEAANILLILSELSRLRLYRRRKTLRYSIGKTSPMLR